MAPEGDTSKSLKVFDPNQINQTDEDEIDLRALWRIFLRYRKLIGGIFLVLVVTALAISLLLRPMYKSTVSLELNTSSRSIVKFQNVESEDLGTREYIETQSNILNSDAVALKVIDELNLVDELEFNGGISQRGLKNGLKSIIDLFKEKRKITEQDVIDRALAIYIDQLSIGTIRNTTLINVSFESFDPALSAKIANAHAKAYILLSNSRRFNSTSGAKQFLEKEIEIVQSKLETSEKQLNKLNQEIISF